MAILAATYSTGPKELKPKPDQKEIPIGSIELKSSCPTDIENEKFTCILKGESNCLLIYEAEKKLCKLNTNQTLLNERAKCLDPVVTERTKCTKKCSNQNQNLNKGQVSACQLDCDQTYQSSLMRCELIVGSMSPRCLLRQVDKNKKRRDFCIKYQSNLGEQCGRIMTYDYIQSLYKECDENPNSIKSRTTSPQELLQQCVFITAARPSVDCAMNNCLPNESQGNQSVCIKGCIQSSKDDMVAAEKDCQLQYRSNLAQFRDCQKGRTEAEISDCLNENFKVNY